MKNVYLFGHGSRVKKPHQNTDNVGGIAPQMRADGKPVTIRNHGNKECVWPYGAPGADMLLCGRVVDCAPYCKTHRAVAYRRQPVAANE